MILELYILKIFLYLAKANCTGNRVCTSCDIVVLGKGVNFFLVRDTLPFHNILMINLNY